MSSEIRRHTQTDAINPSVPWPTDDTDPGIIFILKLV